MKVNLRSSQRACPFDVSKCDLPMTRIHGAELCDIHESSDLVGQIKAEDRKGTEPTCLVSGLIIEVRLRFF